MKVRPADPTALIRDPGTRRPLPAEGGNVPDTHFWRRRLRSGEVVLIVEVAPVAAPVPRRDPTGLEPVWPLTTRDKG